MTAGGWRPAGESVPAAWQRTAQVFAAAVESSRLNLPLPGSGATWQRWAAFADLAEEDLSLARLGEGHADAVAILAELGGAPPLAGSRWGVWAANPPGPNVTASRKGGTWVLNGTKQYCSGARVCTHALVTASAGNEARLFAVAVEGLEPREGSWPATGMAGSDTLDVGFPGVAAEPVGSPGGYTSRPGSATAAPGWPPAGTAGRAAWPGHCCARPPSATSARTRSRTWVRSTSRCARRGVALGRAAAEIDADPDDRRAEGPRRALRVRALTEATATDVLARTGRALGAGPLSHDEAHSRAVADLAVYLRQHHAERDLARLGELVAEHGVTW